MTFHSVPGGPTRRGPGYRVFVVASFTALTPALLFAFLLWHGTRTDSLAIDFSNAFVPAAQAVIDGVSPYPAPDDPVVATGTAYVYPPLTALALTPAAILPEGIAEIGATFANAALVFAILWALAVRDWRCYAVAFTWPAVIAALQTANVTLVLALGAALAWRWRDTPMRAGIALGASIAIKMFLWPLLVWMAATRRWRAAGAAGFAAIALIGAPWAVIGFAGLRDYPALLSRLSELESPHSYAVYALALELGLPEAGATIIWAVFAVSLLTALVFFGCRGHDQLAFTLALAAALACSPIVWIHYFSLLLVAIGIASPRLSPLWFAPLLLWVGPWTGNGGTWQLATVLIAVALTFVFCLSSTGIGRAIPSPAKPPGRG